MVSSVTVFSPPTSLAATRPDSQTTASKGTQGGPKNGSNPAPNVTRRNTPDANSVDASSADTDDSNGADTNDSTGADSTGANSTGANSTGANSTGANSTGANSTETSPTEGPQSKPGSDHSGSPSVPAAPDSVPQSTTSTSIPTAPDPAASAPSTARSSVAAAPVLSFGGHSWVVKSSNGTVGPGPNNFAARNATVDSLGQLHLRITRDKGRWYSSEVSNVASFGYGTYRWTTTTDLSKLDRNVVLGMFTWSDLPEFANREIDVEIARWGSTTDPTNAQFVVQPYGTPGHLQRYVQPSGPSTLEFTWSPGRIDYAVRQGSLVVNSWRYVAPDVPLPGGENIRMNLWQFQGLAPANGQNAEVVFSNFDYCTPLGICQ
jgi:hypothetical protein